MVDIKNNTISLYTDSNKNEFVNKKIGDNFPNLEDQVYKIIKDKIIWHKIKMGERIIDKKLAEELGVSRSMVRQVLAILAKEELLIMVPRNGFYIREITFCYNPVLWDIVVTFNKIYRVTISIYA